MKRIRIRRTLLIALPALTVLVAAVVYRLPAFQVYRWVAGDARAVAASDFSGTLWRGRAGRLQVDGYDLGSAAWRLAPGALLAGRIQLEWQVSGREIEARGRLERALLGESGWRLLGVDGQAPAAWLQVVLREPFFQLEGELDCDIISARIDGEGWLQALDGRCTWVEALISGTLSAPLGNLNIDFSSGGDGIVGTLSDEGGPLGLSGRVVVRERRYEVDAWLEARDERVALRQALAVLGPADPDGRTRVGIHGPMLPLSGWM